MISINTTIALEKFDDNDCCYLIKIKENGDAIEDGLWCSDSGRVVINGECVGNYNTKEDVINTLKLTTIQVYRIVEGANYVGQTLNFKPTEKITQH